MGSFKSGFIALIGRPNAGKSTFINTVVGSKVAIVSKKPQTTRTRITGVLTKKEYQMIFVDTPGIHKGKNKLDDFMGDTVKSAVEDVDGVLFLIDAKNGAKEEDFDIIDNFCEKNVPFVAAINKIDAAKSENVEFIKNKIGGKAKIFEISAKENKGIEKLLKELESFLIEGPKFYPDDMTSDQSKPMLAAEIIREKALKHLGKEIPHGIGVETEKIHFDGKKNILCIDAVIYCEKDSHKGIIIGKGGGRLKKILSDARVEIEELFGQKVFLQAWIKVKEDWRNSPAILKILGYTDN